MSRYFYLDHDLRGRLVPSIAHDRPRPKRKHAPPPAFACRLPDAAPAGPLDTIAAWVREARAFGEPLPGLE